MSFTYDVIPAKDEDMKMQMPCEDLYKKIEQISYVFFSALIHLNFFVRGALHVV